MHSVNVKLIADQEISILGKLINIHDIISITLNGGGIVTDVVKRPKAVPKYYFMNDNHTFESLGEDINIAKTKAMELFDIDPYGLFGVIQESISNKVIANGQGKQYRKEFEEAIESYLLTL